MLPILALLQEVAAKPTGAEIARAVAGTPIEITLSERSERIELQDCPIRGSKCSTRAAIIENESGGTCIDNVIPSVSFKYSNRIGNDTVYYAVPIDIYSSDPKDGLIRSAIVEVRSGNLNKVCVSVTYDKTPGRRFAIRPAAPSEVALAPEKGFGVGGTVLGGLLGGTGKGRTSTGTSASYGNSFVDYVFGRASNTLRQVKIRSRSKSLPIFRGSEKIGVTEEVFYVAESALSDVFLQRGDTRFPISACKKAKPDVLDFIC